MRLTAVFSLLSALTLFAPTADASFTGPLRIVTCEALLSTDFSAYEVGMDIRPPLRDLKAKIQGLGSEFDGTSVSRVKYQGSPYKMSTAVRQKIVERINAIDERLSALEPDSKIVTHEIRGWEAVEAALKLLHDNQLNLNAGYEVLEKDVNSTSDHLVAWMSTIQGRFVTKEWRGRWHQRRGTEIGRLVNFMNEMLYKKRSQDHVFVSSSGLPVDQQFIQTVHGALSNAAADSARRAALRQWGMIEVPELVEFGKMNFLEVLRKFLDGIPSREEGNLGYIFMDEFAYFDEQTHEPVVLLVVRTSRNSPVVRRSREKQKSEVESWQSVPGLQEVLVPIPVKKR